MAAIFAGDAEVMTGFLPFDAMGVDPLPACPRKSDQMGKFMQKGVSQLGFAQAVGEILKPWIEFNAGILCKGPPGGGSHPGVPRHRDDSGEYGQAFFTGEVGGDQGQSCIGAASRMGVGASTGHGSGRTFPEKLSLLRHGLQESFPVSIGSTVSPVTLLNRFSFSPTFVTKESGGTLSLKKTLAPIVERSPITVFPPRTVACG